MRTQPCPRCSTRCVVQDRESVICLACGEEVRAPTEVLGVGIWGVEFSAPYRPPVGGVDRGRHFRDDDADGERWAR